MNRKHLQADVVIVGSGIAGLMIAYELTRKHYSTLLVEETSALACGATTRNQGWLHSGAFQANMLYRREEGRESVTKDVRAGYDYFLSYASDCIEYSAAKMFFIFSSPELGDQAEQRWRALDIRHERVSSGKFHEDNQQKVNADVVKAAFEVADKSIDTARLCRKLVEDTVRQGGRIFTDTRLIPCDSGSADMERGEEKFTVTAGLFVVAAGAGIKKFFEDYTHQPFPMRYWKGFVLVTPKLTPHGLIWQERSKVNVMPHGAVSVMALNYDDLPAANPDYELAPEKVHLLLKSTRQLLPDAAGYEKPSRAYVCLKPDMTDASDEMMSTDIRIGEVVHGYYYCLPGKMTAAPVAAKHILALVEGVKLEKRPGAEPLPVTDCPEVTPRPYGSPVDIQR